MRLKTNFRSHNLEFCCRGQLLICCGISLMFFVGTVVNWRRLALIGKSLVWF